MIKYLARAFASAFVRRIAFALAVIVLGFLGLGRANAQPVDYHGPASESWKHCGQFTAGDQCAPNYQSTGKKQCIFNGSTWVLEQYKCKNGTVEMGWSTRLIHQFSVGPGNCPTGQERDLETGECVDPNARCLALNSEFSGMGPQSRTWTSRCLANGCNIVVDNPRTTNVLGLGSVYTGTLRITGACAPMPPPNTPPDPEGEKKPQDCTAAGSGQTMCVKSNGEKCYSASTGRQICWRDGETGTKTDGNTAQKRTPGTDPQTPPTPPENTTLTPNTPVTTTSSGGGSPNVTTTTVNYTTNTGTDAGSNNDGEPSSGGGEDNGDPTGASGGTDCNTPPIVSGDEALAMVATQAWSTRCAVVAGNAVTVTGNVDDCSQPFTVEGGTGGGAQGTSSASAHQLRALRKAICGDEAQIGQATAAAKGTDGTYGIGDTSGDEAALRAQFESGGPAGLGDFEPDESGFGYSRTCPTIPPLNLMGQVINIDTSNFCDWIALSGQFVLLIAALASMRILLGGGP